MLIAKFKNVDILLVYYVSNFSSPCLLHEQEKDEIIFLGQLHVCLTA